MDIPTLKEHHGKQTGTKALLIRLIIHLFQLFFNQNSIFLSPQINPRYFSADLSAQPNGSEAKES
jgi:hypothetical protein